MQNILLLELVAFLLFLKLILMLFFKIHLELIVILPFLADGLSDVALLFCDLKHPHSQLIDIQLILMQIFTLLPQLKLQLIGLKATIVGLLFRLI